MDIFTTLYYNMYRLECDEMLELEENSRLLKTLEEKLQDLGESL